MSFFFFLVFCFKYVLLLALVSEFNCFLRRRCSVEMWCPDDIGRDSWDWVGPPTWERACFNSPEWGGGSSPVKTELVLLLLWLWLWLWSWPWLLWTRAEKNDVYDHTATSCNVSKTNCTCGRTPGGSDSQRPRHPWSPRPPATVGHRGLTNSP